MVFSLIFARARAREHTHIHTHTHTHTHYTGTLHPVVGTLGLIDFGQVKTLSPEERLANAFFIFNFFVGTLGLIDFGQVKTLSLEERVLYAR